MASQSDANGSNGKARDGGKNGGEEAEPEMEVLKIRFAFWDKNMQALKRTLYTLRVLVRVCARASVCSYASARCERKLAVSFIASHRLSALEISSCK